MFTLHCPQGPVYTPCETTGYVLHAAIFIQFSTTHADKLEHNLQRRLVLSVTLTGSGTSVCSELITDAFTWLRSRTLTCTTRRSLHKFHLFTKQTARRCTTRHVTDTTQCACIRVSVRLPPLGVSLRDATPVQHADTETKFAQPVFVCFVILRLYQLVVIANSKYH